MLRIPALSRGHGLALAALFAAALVVSGCGAIRFDNAPANNYVWGSGEPLRVAVVDQSGPEWSPAIRSALQQYSNASQGYIVFQARPEGAHITVTIKEYTDATPPELHGYDFPQGAGGFATVYDAQGLACNYPPSKLPLNCSGEITRAEIWVNLAIPPGSDIEARRLRLILHEMGHVLGLTRHSPAIEIDTLAQRYGWDLQ
jgi:predicted Zn-dependent protease